MAKDISSYVFSVLSLCASLSFLGAWNCHAAEYYFIIGDSLYDTGNNMIMSPNFPSSRCPYGMTFFHKPTGRLSDGRLVPDFIATELNLPFIPPIMNDTSDFTYGANFASGGAGVLDTNPNALNLPQQYINYTNIVANWEEKLGTDEAKRRLKKAVHLISMGGNDYFSYASKHPDATFRQMQAYVHLVITEFAKVIKDMYKKGARKFVFQNVSPLGCLPVMKSEFNISEGCARPPLTLAVLHNDALTRMAKSIENSDDYSEFTYSIFDYFTLLGERIRIPDQYGFEVGDAPCYDGQGRSERLSDLRAVNCFDESGQFDGEVCNNPGYYVFFDDGHSTDELNRQLGAQLWSGGPDIVYPYNMKQLIEIDPIIKIFPN